MHRRRQSVLSACTWQSVPRSSRARLPLPAFRFADGDRYAENIRARQHRALHKLHTVRPPGQNLASAAVGAAEDDMKPPIIRSGRLSIVLTHQLFVRVHAHPCAHTHLTPATGTLPYFLAPHGEWRRKCWVARGADGGWKAEGVRPGSVGDQRFGLLALVSVVAQHEGTLEHCNGVRRKWLTCHDAQTLWLLS